MLVHAGVQVLLDVAACEQGAVGRLEGHLPVGKHAGPADVEFITDMGLGVVELREHIATLRRAIPAITLVGEVEGFRFGVR